LLQSITGERARHIAAGMRQVWHKALRDRIGYLQKYDRIGLARSQHCD